MHLYIFFHHPLLRPRREIRAGFLCPEQCNNSRVGSAAIPHRSAAGYGSCDWGRPAREFKSCSGVEGHAVDPLSGRTRSGLDGANEGIGPMHVIPRAIAGIKPGLHDHFGDTNKMVHSLQDRERDAKRGREKPWRRFYNTAVWRALRSAQLAKQPLCERCLNSGRVTVATVVNHRRPHRGDWSLFVDPENHESVCKSCHDTLIQREEKRGYVIGSDIDGRPVDPSHPWNR